MVTRRRPFGVVVAGGDAHLGDLAFVAGEGHALLLGLDGECGELIGGERDLNHGCEYSGRAEG